MGSVINIQNRKASFEYAFLERYRAGIVLKGSEVKSVREGKANINEAYCYVRNGEVFIKGMHIAEYKNAGAFAHAAVADRKLLLTKKEIKKITEMLKNKGLTLIPLALFINERGFVKLEVAVAKGKKVYDKRETLRKRDIERAIRKIHR